MVDVFVQLLRDREPEVRSAAASQITGFCKLISEETIINTILPVVTELARDKDESVRGIFEIFLFQYIDFDLDNNILFFFIIIIASLAGDVMGLAPLLGKEKTLENLLDLFLKLLSDDFYEVRLSVISKLNGINEVVGIELLSDSLLPAIGQLANESQWRVRLAIIKFIPLLAKQLVS